MWPDTTETAPNSPSARALHSSTPYSSAQRMFGSVTRQNVCQPLAPRLSAASSSSVPCCSISGISSRATKGNVTKIVASTMPGSAKTIFGSCRCSSPSSGSVNRQPSSISEYAQPCAPKIST